MQPFLNENSKVIAVDFDGTIVEHKYPAIGKEMLFAFATLKALQQKGHKLILWTIRTGDLLQEAVDYCRQNGVEFYAVNKNYPEEMLDDRTSRKLNADVFIDDRNLGGFIGWSEIWQTLHPDGGEFSHQLKNMEAHINFRKNESSIFKKLFGAK
jgi:hydroxymethylpyrimidine pyrophosphatase-like HAD family hydrolase